MVVLVTDDPGNMKEVRDLFAVNGLKTHIVPIKGFKEGLKADVDLIIYDTYNLRGVDVENIRMAKGAGIPLILITAYPNEKAKDEISNLWREGLLKGYLLKPVDLERLAEYLPSARSASAFNQPQGVMQ